MEINIKLELKLSNIEFKNFRLFEDLKLHFHDKLTVVISENGSGKTALLEGIAKILFIIAETAKVGTKHDDAFKELYQNTDIKLGEKQLSTKIELEKTAIMDRIKILQMVEKDLETAQKSYDAYVEQNKGKQSYPPPIMGTIFHLKAVIKHFSEYEQNDLLNKQCIQKRSMSISKKLDTQIHIENSVFMYERIPLIRGGMMHYDVNFNHLPILLYYSSNRIYMDTKDNLEKDTDTEKINAYDNALNGRALNFKWFLEWFIWKEDNLKTDSFILEAVKNAIFEILNDDSIHTFKAIYTDRTRKRDYRLVVEKDNTRIDVNLLSSGEKSLLMLVGDLARRLALANPEAKDPLKEGQGIVLIDEIDLHLHPRWQRKVMRKLQEIFPKIQWVVSTHSPLVISGYDILPEQVLILTQEENTNKKLAISLADLHVHNSGVEPNRILEEIMQVRLRDKMAEDKIIALSQLLNPVDFEKPATRQLMEELTHRFGTDDPFIKRAEHTLKILYRKKASNE